MSSGFISATELAEQRKRRQEEWERVRTADQPAEAPEEQYDPRCLFDRLQEQKNKKDAEYEEAHKLKNMIKGLDDDEVEFLDLVDRQKMDEERKKHLEEEKEMREFKEKVASLQEKSLDARLKQELKQPQLTNRVTVSNKNSQLKLLAGVVKKPVKSSSGSPPKVGEKRKLSDSEKTEDNSQKNDPEFKSGALKCVGILPGLGSYDNSSDSEDSSDSDDDEVHCKKSKRDFIGRETMNRKLKDED
uniref:FAM192A/Fyv6 N-terminal domain-containing protein n=1 Tax=Trichogramma kaykai TaxID=54128 RepID=A0ABD2WC84_9HYME